MNEHDLRQLRLMRDLLQQYDSGKTDLSSLIAGLEALLDALESATEEWKRAFRRQWGVLEIEYAVALDREQTALSDDSLERISRAVEDIRCLLAEHLQGDDQPTD
jgi:hypothetical protein